MGFADAFDNAPNGVPKPTSGLDAFDDAKAFKPLPVGRYVARIVSGTFTQTKRGDDAYRMTFEVSEGEHKGERVSRTWVFSEKAIGYAKRDLAVFGLTTSKHLLEVYPPIGREVYVKLLVALQQRDDGIVGNDIKRFEIIRDDASPAAGFLIDPDKPQGGTS